MNEKSFRFICCYDKDMDNLRIDVMEVRENGVELHCTFEGEEAKLVYKSLIEQNLVEEFKHD